MTNEEFLSDPDWMSKMHLLATVTFDPNSESVTSRAKVIQTGIEQGREAWKAIHTKTNPTREWFENEWKPLIPQGCGCSESANELLDQNPPRFDSPEEFFVWTVEYHNAVNQKLINQGDTTKKIVSLEEAKQIWNRE